MLNHAVGTVPVGDPGVEYRPVVNFAGYAVGDDGSVWSSRHVYGTRRWHRLKPGKLKTPRLQVALMRDGNAVHRFVHQLIAEAFIGPCPDGMIVRHYPNPDPTDNRPCNLRYGTPKDNGQDMVEHGNSQKGTKHHQAKLNEDQVLEIRLILESGRSIMSVAKQFGVSKSLVFQIRRRQIWKHI